MEAAFLSLPGTPLSREAAAEVDAIVLVPQTSPKRTVLNQNALGMGFCI